MIGRRIQIAIASLIRCLLVYERPSYDAVNVTWSGEEVYIRPQSDAVNAQFDVGC